MLLHLNKDYKGNCNPTDLQIELFCRCYLNSATMTVFHEEHGTVREIKDS